MFHENQLKEGQTTVSGINFEAHSQFQGILCFVCGKMTPASNQCAATSLVIHHVRMCYLEQRNARVHLEHTIFPFQLTKQLLAQPVVHE